MCSETDIDTRRGNRWSGGPVGDGLEWAVADFPDHRFSPHRHDGYVVGITTRGSQRFTYRGTEQVSGPGQVFLLHPDELHDGRPGSDAGFGFRAIYLSPGQVLSALDAVDLPFSPQAVHAAAPVMRCIETVFRHWSSGAGGDLMMVDTVCMIADMLRALSDNRDHQVRRRRERPVDPTICRVRDDLIATAAGAVPVTMQDLELRHGIGRFALSRQFRRAFGVPPSRFLMLCRLGEVRRLLLHGESLALAAMAAGFADQSHMTRNFRATYGVTPGRWQRMQRAGIGFRSAMT